MLKLHPEYKIYPLITLGLGAVIFLIISILIVPLAKGLESSMPFGVTLYLFLLTALFSLIILNILLFKKIPWLKLVVISLIIGFLQSVSTYIAFPFFMLLYAMGGSDMTPISNMIYIYILGLVAILIYSMALYEKKGFTSLPFIAGLISFPITLLYNFVTKNNDDLSVYSFFISIGASLGLYIGLKEYKIIREIIGG
jgi:hypothetical protein